MERNKKIKMLTRNDKMTTNSRGVKMVHWETSRVLNMKIFLLQAIEGIKTLRIESIGYNVGRH
jgi:hypothetical protein